MPSTMLLSKHESDTHAVALTLVQCSRMWGDGSKRPSREAQTVTDVPAEDGPLSARIELTMGGIKTSILRSDETCPAVETAHGSARAVATAGSVASITESLIHLDVGQVVPPIWTRLE